MEEDSTILKQPVTPEYVLAVFNEWNRQDYEANYLREPPELLTLATTIEDWFFDDDFLTWSSVAHRMNNIWGLSIPRKEWKAVLSPVGKKTLAGVCQLIARHARAPVIRERSFFGKPCRPASVFLTIRAMLQEAGVDVSEIRPSTSLEEYARQHWELFWGDFTMLAPGALPPCRFVRTPGQTLETACITIGAGMFVLGLVLGMIDPLILFFPLILCLLLLVRIFCFPALGPTYVYFGDLKTFRDLSETIAVHEAARIC
ncbi:hypothetical protein Pan241w_28640 [Gimesia alba]|uniref:Uncharacterized protein n=2 Tax=Gimesia alba TaxID=2527973 RepID=A0A517RG05_9PLAN|nr:hypothetical protein Pan241w_28640 [Gimesia alba]